MSEIKLTKMVIPAFNRIITTANKYKSDFGKGGIIDTSKSTDKYMDIQTVVAVGPRAQGVEVGDVVSLSFERYKTVLNKSNSLKDDTPELQKLNKVVVYNVPTRVIDGTEYFLLGDNDVEFVIPEGGYEEVTDEVSPIIQPDTSLIV